MADKGFYAKLGLKDEEFRKKLQQNRGQINNFATSLKSLAGSLAAAFSVGAIINFSKESMAAYGEQIKSEAKLQTALKGRKDVTDRLVQQANELQKVTLFGDEDIINGQALLATFTQNEQQLKTLTPLVLDYAQAFGMDVASAAKQVGKALVSANGAIGKSGIEAEGAAGSYERYANLVQALTDKFIGQAENAIPEALKAQRELTVSLDEMKESWGDMVTSIANAGLFKWMSEELNYLSWGLNKIKKEGGGFKKWWQWFWSSGDFTEESYAMEQNAIKNAEQLQKNANILQGVSGGFKTYGEMVDASAAANKAATPVIEKTAEELAKEKKAAEDAAKAYQKYLEETRKTAQGTDVGHMTSQTAGAEMNTGRFLRTGEMQFDLALPTDQLDEFELKLKELPGSYTEFVDSMSEESERLADAFNEMGAAVGSALGEFIKGEATFGEVAENLLQSIIKIVAGYLTESVAASFAGGASAGGPAAPFTGAASAASAAALFGSLVPALMAQGGTVPTGYPNDSYPAMLTSGETVVPPHKLGEMGGNLSGSFKIKGSDLVYVVNKEMNKLSRNR